MCSYCLQKAPSSPDLTFVVKGPIRLDANLYFTMTGFSVIFNYVDAFEVIFVPNGFYKE